MQCPECGPNRKKSGEKTLSVKIDGEYAVYFCHHCEESGSVNVEEEELVSEVSADVSPELVVNVITPSEVLYDAETVASATTHPVPS